MSLNRTFRSLTALSNASTARVLNLHAISGAQHGFIVRIVREADIVTAKFLCPA